MGKIVMFTLIWLITWAVLVTIVGAVVRMQVLKANRVDPSVPTRVPTLWLWSPSRPARLHRRLRASVSVLNVSLAPRTTAPGATPPSGSLDAMRASVIDQAVQADCALGAAYRLRRPARRHALDQIEALVVEIERLTARIIDIHRNVDAAHGISTMPDVDRQARALDAVSRDLDILEEAHLEIASIERQMALDGFTGPAGFTGTPDGPE